MHFTQSEKLLPRQNSFKMTNLVASVICKENKRLLKAQWEVKAIH